MKKILLMLVATVMIFGCAVKASNVPVAVPKVTLTKSYNYPVRMPKNPNVIAFMDRVREAGHKVVGVADNVDGDYLIWMEIDGECVCLVWLFTSNEQILVSCEDGLKVWEMCRQNGKCIEPGTRI
jgi:hypothetical protein